MKRIFFLFTVIITAAFYLFIFSCSLPGNASPSSSASTGSTINFNPASDFIYTGILSITITDYIGLSTTVSIPSTIDGLPVTSIGGAAFKNCTSLTSIIIPSSVTSIGNCAFDSCSGLTSITIPSSVNSIGTFAFEGCYSLTCLPNLSGVTTIGNSAFLGCTGFTSITIPSNITYIGIYAFESCTGLTTVTVQATTPITALGGINVFDGDTSLNKILVPSSFVNAYKIAQYWSNYTLIINGY